MIQGEEGEHMYFIEEGEVEVHYDGNKPTADLDSEMDSDDFGDDDLGDVPERPEGDTPQELLPRAHIGPQVINTAGKGDFIGEIAVFSEVNVRTASVRAKTDVRALQICRDDALVVLGGQPEARGGACPSAHTCRIFTRGCPHPFIQHQRTVGLVVALLTSRRVSLSSSLPAGD